MGPTLIALRQRRHDLGLSQRALGERIGISQPVLAAYESGARQPGIDSIERIADGLDTQVGILSTVDVVAIVEANPDLRRDAILSLVLAHQTVVELLVDPERVRRIAHARLEAMLRLHARSRHWFDQWDELLRGPQHLLVAALLDPSSDAVDLRQSAPFAEVVDQDTRALLIAALRRRLRSRPSTERGPTRHAS